MEIFDFFTKKNVYLARHHEMLMYCSYKGDTFLWNDWRQKNSNQIIELATANLQKTNLQEVNLENAILWGANLQEANLSEANLLITDFSKANLRGANFKNAFMQVAILQNANLQEANFVDANLQIACLIGANLQGASIVSAKLQCANFELAQVDGMTVIADCEFDRKTNFSGVGLDSATIEPGLKTAFRDNIRRNKWQEWFLEGNLAVKALKNLLVRPFWHVTGYGSSTTYLILYFSVLVLGFAGLYFILAISDSSIIKDLSVCGMPWYHILLRAVYFSVATMTTLGFGDLYAMKTGYWGHACITLHVMIGYILLGAIVTRLGILFTNEAPAAKPTYLKHFSRKPKLYRKFFDKCSSIWFRLKIRWDGYSDMKKSLIFVILVYSLIAYLIISLIMN